MIDELRIVKWFEWQRRALYDSTRGRAKDGRLKRRLSYVALSVECTGKEFLAFAAAVGGRNAETFWVRTIQYVGLHAPETGVLTGISRRNFAQVLSRPHDSVKPGTAAKVFDALLLSGLATSGPVPEGVTAPVPAPYTPQVPVPVPAPTGPIESQQGVTANSCDNACARIVTSEVDVEGESKTVVAVAVDVDRHAAAAASAPQREAGCSRCRDGLITPRGAPPRCCDCARGRRRALAMARCQAEEEASAARHREGRASGGPARALMPLSDILADLVARGRVPDGRRVQTPVAAAPAQ
jgi:hypothetical protein